MKAFDNLLGFVCYCIPNFKKHESVLNLLYLRTMLYLQEKETIKKFLKECALFTPQTPLSVSLVFHVLIKECVVRINRIFLYTQNLLMRESELIQVSRGGRTQTLLHGEPSSFSSFNE